MGHTSTDFAVNRSRWYWDKNSWVPYFDDNDRRAPSSSNTCSVLDFQQAFMAWITNVCFLQSSMVCKREKRQNKSKQDFRTVRTAWAQMWDPLLWSQQTNAQPSDQSRKWPARVFSTLCLPSCPCTMLILCLCDKAWMLYTQPRLSGRYFDVVQFVLGPACWIMNIDWRCCSWFFVLKSFQYLAVRSKETNSVQKYCVRGCRKVACQMLVFTRMWPRFLHLEMPNWPKRWLADGLAKSFSLLFAGESWENLRFRFDVDTPVSFQ